jgi:hypothetical protein
MTTNYLTVKCAGFTAYCNALIARTDSGDLQACMLSLIGTPSHIKSLSALIYTGESCHISGDNLDTELKFAGLTQTCRSRKIGETVNKVLITNFFSKNNNTAAVFGPDLSLVQERAFRRLDATTTIPLKSQWQEWLWETMIYPEKLYSFGSSDFQEAYLLTIPCDETLESHVLEAIKNRQIQ